MRLMKPLLATAACMALAFGSLLVPARKATGGVLRPVVVGYAFHFLDNLEVLTNLLQRSDIGGTGEAPPAELSFCAGFLDFVLRADEHRFPKFDSVEVLLELGNQSIGLGEGEHLLQVLSFFTLRHEATPDSYDSLAQISLLRNDSNTRLSRAV